MGRGLPFELLDRPPLPPVEGRPRLPLAAHGDRDGRDGDRRDGADRGPGRHVRLRGRAPEQDPRDDLAHPRDGRERAWHPGSRQGRGDHPRRPGGAVRRALRPPAGDALARGVGDGGRAARDRPGGGAARAPGPGQAGEPGRPRRPSARDRARSGARADPGGVHRRRGGGDLAPRRGDRGRHDPEDAAAPRGRGLRDRPLRVRLCPRVHLHRDSAAVRGAGRARLRHRGPAERRVPGAPGVAGDRREARACPTGPGTGRR